VGYFGTIVVARTAQVLARQDGMELFGFRHRWLRDLGGGWQMVETSGASDPPRLADGAAAVAGSTGAPVLGQYVSGGDCVHVQTAVPGTAPGPGAHLPDVTGTCGVYRHNPAPVGRDPGDVLRQWCDWARAGGLTPDVEALRTLLYRPIMNDAYEVALGLVRALAVERIGKTRPYAVPIDEPPFDRFCGQYDDLPYRARTLRAMRLDLPVGVQPVGEWERLALDLEKDLWAALYDPEADVARLAERAAHVGALHDEARDGRPMPPEEIEIGGVMVTNPEYLDRMLNRARRGRPAGHADFARHLADSVADPYERDLRPPRT
jgi:hypothetical protein